MTETANKAMPKASRKEQDAGDELRVTAINSIAGADRAAWDACANPNGLRLAAERPC